MEECIASRFLWKNAMTEGLLGGRILWGTKALEQIGDS